MANVVGERFQITIEKGVRKALGIRPGDRAIERVEDDHLVIDFMPAPHRESLLGILKRSGQPVITDWEAVKDAAWRARADEITEVLADDSRRHATDR
jgi:AbrB family looped-hinge helix DNA binding protein